MSGDSKVFALDYAYQLKYCNAQKFGFSLMNDSDLYITKKGDITLEKTKLS